MPFPVTKSVWLQPNAEEQSSLITRLFVLPLHVRIFKIHEGFFSVKIKVIDNLEKSTFSFPILGQLMTTITKQREDE